MEELLIKSDKDHLEYLEKKFTNFLFQENGTSAGASDCAKIAMDYFKNSINEYRKWKDAADKENKDLMSKLSEANYYLKMMVGSSDFRKLFEASTKEILSHLDKCNSPYTNH